MKTKLLLYSALLLLTQCSKCKNDPQPNDPADQLPPATQTGANTLGCLVNSQPWTPQGNAGTSNYSLYYDRSYRGGNFGVNTYRLSGGFAQYIIFGGDSIAAIGAYSLSHAPRTVFFLDNRKPTACQDYSGQAGQYSRGTLVITRLDLQAGIVSGTFAFTLYKPGCDSIRVTQGRFDKKL